MRNLVINREKKERKDESLSKKSLIMQGKFTVQNVIASIGLFYKLEKLNYLPFAINKP